MFTNVFTLLLAIPLASAQSTSAFQSTILDLHNQYRTLHQVGNVLWSETIAAAAQNHTASCNFALASTRFGQILGAGVFYPNAGGVVEYWYEDGAEAYDYDNPGFSSETGAFTQIVWRGTREIGCGFTACDGKNGVPGDFITCFYFPPGNVQGQFAKNVRQPPSAGDARKKRNAEVGDRLKLSTAAVNLRA